MIDFTDREDADNLNDTRKDFADIVFSLERHLDAAEQYGSHRDMRMLGELDAINAIAKDVPAAARNAEEAVPIRNYHTSGARIFADFFVLLISNELARINDMMDTPDGDREEAYALFRELQNVVPYYSNIYPEVDISTLDPKMEEVRIKFN